MIQTRTASYTEGVDTGLRAHMLSVYNYMAGGLAVSALVAAAVTVPVIGQVFFAHTQRGVQPTGLGYVAMFAPLAMLFLAAFVASGWSTTSTKVFYWVFTAVEGVGLSLLAYRYGGADITRAFFVTAAGFSALSIWGYTTQRDLSPVGSFCIMGLFGMIATALICALTGARVPDFIFCTIGVVVFSGLTAYDTQKIKTAYNASRSDGGRDAIWGALQLYLDFLNLFMLILRLTGSRR